MMLRKLNHKIGHGQLTTLMNMHCTATASYSLKLQLFNIIDYQFNGVDKCY